MGAGASGCAGVSSVVSEADGSNQSDQDHQEQAWHIGDLGYTSFEAHFEAGRMLGKGSFGSVRIARYRRNDYQYAVKILGKDEMIRLQQVGNVKAEKRIMQMADHPSLIALAGSLQDTVFLYLVLELAHGGDLFQCLRRMERFPVPTARFYAAQVVLGLEHLHSLGVVYRDLKPENLMLDRLGNIKITDFGFAKLVEDRTWTMLGTPEYVAPEIIRSLGYSFAVDWWAMGILLYEMLVGWPPFMDENPMLLFKKILKARLGFPKEMPQSARRCIRRLLQPDRSKRLGNINGGVRRVKEHEFFEELNWEDLENLHVEPPYVPQVTSEDDASNFANFVQDQNQGVDPASALDTGASLSLQTSPQIPAQVQKHPPAPEPGAAFTMHGCTTGKAVGAERSDGEAVVGKAVIGPGERDDNQIRRLSFADDELFRDF